MNTCVQEFNFQNTRPQQTNKITGLYQYPLRARSVDSFKTSKNNKSSLTTAKIINPSYLIVPVGDGTGEANVESDGGMFIRSGGGTFVRGGLGTRFGVLSLTRDVNRTFTFVDGNRKTQLKETNQQYLKSPRWLCNTRKARRRQKNGT